MSTRSRSWVRRLATLLLIVELVGGALPGLLPPASAAPAAQATGEAHLRALLAQAQAALDEATKRRDQATAGQGGIGARTEDIAIAQAELDAARVELRLRQPFDDLRFLRGPILLYQGLEEGMRQFRKDCGDLQADTKFEIRGNESDTHIETDIRCSGNMEDSLDAIADSFAASRKSAELELKQFTKPAPTIAAFLAPYEQAVRKAELELQRRRTGGDRDQATLDLNVALAQADVDTIQAMLAGSVGGQLEAQLRGARARLSEAQYRQKQAADGQGGRDARAENIAEAEADLRAAEANLQYLLHPLEEDVDQARADVAKAAALKQSAEATRKACDDALAVSKFRGIDQPANPAPEPEDTDIHDTLVLPGASLPPISIAGETVVPPAVQSYIIDLARARIREAIIDAIRRRIRDALERLRDRIRAAFAEMEIRSEGVCNGDKRDALTASIDAAAALQTMAEQKLKLLTTPNPQQFGHQIEQKQQAIEIAKAKLQEARTGGSSDQQTLILNVARAQADVDGLEALLAGDLAGYNRAHLRGAQAALAEATFRTQQAQSGTGGRDARAEDIAVATAQLALDKATLLTIADPAPEVIQILQSTLDAAEAGVRKARANRRACDGLQTIARTNVNDNQLPTKTFTESSCSDDSKDALEAATSIAIAKRDIAQTALNLFTAPTEQAIRNFVAEPAANIKIDEANLAKLQTGGSADAATLDLNQALAQAEVDFWQAAVDNAPRRQVEAQLAGAQARLKEAEFRQQQAQGGQGGADAREQDIAIAQIKVALAQAKVLIAADPTPESVTTAELQFQAASAAVRQARKERDACDDPRSVAIKKKDDDDPDPAQRQVTHIHCSGGITASLDAAIDQAKAEETAAQLNRDFVVAPHDKEFFHIVEPYRQGVVAAQAQLQKLVTGGSNDQATLDRNAAVARADVARFQAVLDGNRAAELQARVDAAQAVLTEATYRVQQAQSGTGGVDARPEDIAIAQANLAAAKEQALALVDLPPEQVGAARANVDAAEAGVRIADGTRKACGKVRVVSVTKTNGKEENLRTVTDPNCSDERDAANELAVDSANATLETARQQYKFLTDPAMPEALYIVVPGFKAAEAAGARLQKAVSGGSRDLQTLQLNAAVARTELDRWRAELAGLPVDAARARAEGARLDREEAQARQQQAASGQGSQEVRAEDIAIATADRDAAGAKLQTALTPPKEIVRSAELAVDVVDLTAARVHHLSNSCDETRMTTTFNLNDNGGDDNGNSNSNDNDEDQNGLGSEVDGIKIKTHIKCPDDIEGGLDSIATGIEGFRLVPVAALALLTDLAGNEKLQVIVQGRKSGLAEAEATLKKQQTGGSLDALRFATDVSLTSARLTCRQAVVDETARTGPPGQPPPFVWSDPDPCVLVQLPGKTPPYLEKDVRPGGGSSSIPSPVTASGRRRERAADAVAIPEGRPSGIAVVSSSYPRSAPEWGMRTANLPRTLTLTVVSTDPESAGTARDGRDVAWSRRERGVAAPS